MKQSKHLELHISSEERSMVIDFKEEPNTLT